MLVQAHADHRTKIKYLLLNNSGRVNEEGLGVFEVTAEEKNLIETAGLVAIKVAKATPKQAKGKTESAAETSEETATEDAEASAATNDDRPPPAKRTGRRKPKAKA